MSMSRSEKTTDLSWDITCSEIYMIKKKWVRAAISYEQMHSFSNSYWELACASCFRKHVSLIRILGCSSLFHWKHMNHCDNSFLLSVFFLAKIPIKTQTNNWWNTAFSWKWIMFFFIKTSSFAFDLKSRQEPFNTECEGQTFQWEPQFGHISSLFSLRYLNRWFIAPSVTQGINFSAVLNIIYGEILVCSECDKNGL